MDRVTLSERLFAPSENLSGKFNTSVYGNVVFNKKSCTKQADPLYHVDEVIKMRKKK